MDIKSHFNSKLSELLFMEINSGAKLGEYILEDSIYIPLKAKQIIEKVKQGEDFKKIPMMYFVEGMFYVIGADKDFKFKSNYIEILKEIPESIKFIKSKIYEEVNKESFEEAYILLSGLLCLEENKEIYEKVLLVIDRLRNENEKIYKEEELRIIERAKSFEDFAEPYLFECLINRDAEDFTKALYCLNTYLSKNGKETMEITELKQNLSNINNYEKGKQLTIDEPKEALQILLPLLDVYADSASIYYHIAVAYRNLENYEKAIYYLNEAIAIDNALVEVVNEFGINYASLGDYETAIKYFRKAFEPTKSIEICTNIIMCYLNLGKIEDAKQHFEIAVRLDPNDEIVNQLKDILSQYNN